MSWFPTQIKSLLHKSLCQRCIYCSAPTRSRTVLYGLKGRCNPPVSRHLPIYDGSIGYHVCTHLATIGIGYRLHLFLTFYALNHNLHMLILKCFNIFFKSSISNFCFTEFQIQRKRLNAKVHRRKSIPHSNNF